MPTRATLLLATSGLLTASLSTAAHADQVIDPFTTAFNGKALYPSGPVHVLHQPGYRHEERGLRQVPVRCAHRGAIALACGLRTVGSPAY
jgi:hypothetical protein